MGIDGFLGWLRSEFPEVTIPFPNTGDGSSSHSNYVSHILFDMNQMVHSALRRRQMGKPSVDTYELVRGVFYGINTVLRMFHPTKSVLFAFDGTVPKGKLQARRKKRANLNLSKDTISAVEITSGTSLMNDIKEALEYFVCLKLQIDVFSGVEFIVSASNTPGEGEMKITEKLRAISSESIKRPVVVVGSDADLCLFALTSPVRNVLLLNFQESLLLGVEVVKCALHRLFPHYDIERVQLDVLLLSVLCGNDYVPKLSGSNLQRLWESYLELRRMHPSFHSRPFVHINEDGMITHIDGEFFKEIIRRSCVLRSEESHDSEGSRGERRKFHTQMYLSTLIWYLRVASTSVCRNYSWHYPYPCAPSPKFLLECSNNEFLPSNISPAIFRDVPPMSLVSQLACVLPPSCAELLPSPIVTLLSNENGELSELIRGKRESMNNSMDFDRVAAIVSETISRSHLSSGEKPAIEHHQAIALRAKDDFAGDSTDFPYNDMYGLPRPPPVVVAYPPRERTRKLVWRYDPDFYYPFEKRSTYKPGADTGFFPPAHRGGHESPESYESRSSSDHYSKRGTYDSRTFRTSAPPGQYRGTPEGPGCWGTRNWIPPTVPVPYGMPSPPVPFMQFGPPGMQFAQNIPYQSNLGKRDRGYSAYLPHGGDPYRMQKRGRRY